MGLCAGVRGPLGTGVDGVAAPPLRSLSLESPLSLLAPTSQAHRDQDVCPSCPALPGNTPAWALGWGLVAMKLF